MDMFESLENPYNSFLPFEQIIYICITHLTPNFNAVCYQNRVIKIESISRRIALHSIFIPLNTNPLTLSSLNLPLSSSSTTSRELLSQFSACSERRRL